MKTMVAVVTGASGGIGKCLVQHLQSKGFLVCSIDRVVAASNTRETLTAGLSIQLDVSSQSNAEEAATTIGRRCGCVELLVNAAGTFHTDSEIAQHPELATTLWRDNFLSAFYLSNAFIPVMRGAQSPLIVNIGSADAIVASGGQDCEVGVLHDSYYASTKGAVVTFSRCLAMRLARIGIRVNVVSPTIVRTPMAASLLSIADKETELLRHIPLGRLCEPQDVADAIYSLYGMKMCTAHMLPVDGGYLCL